MINIKAATAAAALSLAAAALILSIAAAKADGGRPSVARLIMADGRPVSAAMATGAACVAFTRAIAAYVESANCETRARKETSS